MSEEITILKEKMDEKNFAKLTELNNPKLNNFILEVIKSCNPKDIFVHAGKNEDTEYITNRSISDKEEISLKTDGHTMHFDGINDQARDKKSTKLLVPSDMEFDENLNYIDRDAGLKEVKEIMTNLMEGHTMYILFFTLGPNNSEFSIPAVQLTDSAYVAHTELLLYRSGYEDFKNLKDKEKFFRFAHTTGPLDERKSSINLDKRRIYIDFTDNITYSTNTQYGGNTLGLKKLAMRLAINLSSKEGWLCEHMFVMGVNGPNGRKAYFIGAYPSACGKTSTSMLSNETIVGDDIAYLKIKNDKIYAVNVEKGMFGIIDGVNAKDDPIIWDTLHKPNDIIFSNSMIKEDNSPYWNENGEDLPEKGTNFAGEWIKSNTGDNEKPLPTSHKNARFALSLDILSNVDENLHTPEGVAINGIIYGGRDSDTSVPVEEAFDWEHGVICKGAALESETTAATLGAVGQRVFNPMSNLDFLSIPISKYIDNNLKFGKKLSAPPKIFSVNYFIKDKEGNFLNDKTDKTIWINWMELRSHNEVAAITAPTGLIPEYDDLKNLFNTILNKNYTEEDYIKQFTIRIPENLSKIERITDIYINKIKNTPEVLFTKLNELKERLLALQKEKGDYVSPLDL